MAEARGKGSSSTDRRIVHEVVNVEKPKKDKRDQQEEEEKEEDDDEEEEEKEEDDEEDEDYFDDKHTPTPPRSTSDRKRKLSQSPSEPSASGKKVGRPRGSGVGRVSNLRKILNDQTELIKKQLINGLDDKTIIATTVKQLKKVDNLPTSELLTELKKVDETVHTEKQVKQIIDQADEETYDRYSILDEKPPNELFDQIEALAEKINDQREFLRGLEEHLLVVQYTLEKKTSMKIIKSLIGRALAKIIATEFEV